MSVAGKTAIVTGAGTGIGRATAELLAARGARVVAAGLQPERLRETVGGDRAPPAARRSPSTPTSRSPRPSSAWPRRAAQAFGGTDVLVNNAAVYPIGPWHEMDAAQWDAVFATNIRGYFLLARAVRPQMIARGGGTDRQRRVGHVLHGRRAAARLRRVEGRRHRLHARARARGGPGGHPRQRGRARRLPDRRHRDPRRPGQAVARTCSRLSRSSDAARSRTSPARSRSSPATTRASSRGQTLLVDGGWMRLSSSRAL